MEEKVGVCKPLSNDKLYELDVFELIECDWCGSYITDDNPVKVDVESNLLNRPENKDNYEICTECLNKLNKLITNADTK